MNQNYKIRPFTAIYWASYETYKKYLKTGELSIRQSFVGGALSGMVIQVIKLICALNNSSQYISLLPLSLCHLML